ncbi:MAG: tetratricopeptide repeat protein [Pseudomonadota bacterium]
MVQHGAKRVAKSAAIAVSLLALAGIAVGAQAQLGPQPDSGKDGLERLLPDPNLPPAPPSADGPEQRPGAPPRTADKRDLNAAYRALLRPQFTRIPRQAHRREQLLDILYAHLATAQGPKAAKRIAQTIERVWLTSGSPTVSVLMRRAMLAIKGKKHKRAKLFLDRVVKLSPSYPDGWNRRAYVHYQLGDVRAALGDLRRALALDPNHFKALGGLAQILRGMDEKKAALAVYDRLLQVHPYAKGAEQAKRLLEPAVRGQAL